MKKIVGLLLLVLAGCEGGAPGVPSPDKVDTTRTDSGSGGTTTTTQSVSLNSVNDLSVNEGVVTTLTINATSTGSVVFSCDVCPSFASVNSSTGQLTLTPGYSDAGIYGLKVVGTLGELSSSASFNVTVNNVNRAPVIGSAPDRSVAEGDLLDFTIPASDPDGDTVDMNVTSSLPANFYFASSASGLHIWGTPSYSESGTYPVNISATDGSLTATASFSIVVSNVNRLAVFDDIPAKSVNQNTLLSFGVHAVDPDGDIPTYSASNLPSGATFNTSTATFAWTPSCSQEGSFNVTFSATDDHGAMANVNVPITVNHVNCYDPTWFATNYIRGANNASGGYTSGATTWYEIQIRNIAVRDLQPGINKVGYTGTYFDCNNTAATSVVVEPNNYQMLPDYSTFGNPSYDARQDQGQAIRITLPAQSGNYWFLFYGEDQDGVRIYAWYKIARGNANDYYTVGGADPVIAQGKTYSTTGFCGGAGFMH